MQETLGTSAEKNILLPQELPALRLQGHRRWLEPDAQQKVQALIDAGVPEGLAPLYYSRGVDSPAEVEQALSRLPAPSTLKGLSRTGDLLLDRCVRQRQRIVIVGDYDCDGATSTAILVRAFARMGLDFGWLAPDRQQHGYGLSPAIVELAAQGWITSDMDYLKQREALPGLPVEMALVQARKPDLIITVDNGTSSIAGVECARKHGIEVIVTDHHLAGSELPAALALVNPTLDEQFEGRFIAGCGVAWYVACDVLRKFKALPEHARHPAQAFSIVSLLPLVALGTVADMVPLDSVNRRLAALGADLIRKGRGPVGVQALMDEVGNEVQHLNCSDIGFGVGPRLNAAGRIAYMGLGIDCLVTDDADFARRCAQKLTYLNQERKDMQAAMQAQAEEQLGELDLSPEEGGEELPVALVVQQAGWHKGIVGIMAGQLKEKHWRPVFALAQEPDGTCTGSGRSIAGLHLKHALDEIAAQHPDMFLKYGGHAMAAGLTLYPGQFEAFKAAFEQVAAQRLTRQDLARSVAIDGILPAKALTAPYVDLLEKAIWGQGFAAPLFLNRFRVLSCRRMGATGKHTRLELQLIGTQADGDNTVLVEETDQVFVAVRFFEAGWEVPPGEQPLVDIIYEPALVRRGGVTSVQIRIAHLALAQQATPQLRLLLALPTFV